MQKQLLARGLSRRTSLQQDMRRSGLVILLLLIALVFNAVQYHIIKIQARDNASLQSFAEVFGGRIRPDLPHYVNEPQGETHDADQ